MFENLINLTNFVKFDYKNNSNINIYINHNKDNYVLIVLIKLKFKGFSRYTNAIAYNK